MFSPHVDDVGSDDEEFLLRDDSEEENATIENEGAFETASTPRDIYEDYFGEDEKDITYWLSEDQVMEMTEKSIEGPVKVPPPLKEWHDIKIPIRNKDEDEWNNMFALDSCYHVAHRETFNGKDWSYIG